MYFNNSRLTTPLEAVLLHGARDRSLYKVSYKARVIIIACFNLIMLKINSFILEDNNNTFKISQNKDSGMYLIERINNFDDNDISSTTVLTMQKGYEWIDDQKQLYQ